MYGTLGYLALPVLCLLSAKTRGEPSEKQASNCRALDKSRLVPVVPGTRAGGTDPYKTVRPSAYTTLGF